MILPLCIKQADTLRFLKQKLVAVQNKLCLVKCFSFRQDDAATSSFCSLMLLCSEGGVSVLGEIWVCRFLLHSKSYRTMKVNTCYSNNYLLIRNVTPHSCMHTRQHTQTPQDASFTLNAHITQKQKDASFSWHTHPTPCSPHTHLTHNMASAYKNTVKLL